MVPFRLVHYSGATSWKWVFLLGQGLHFDLQVDPNRQIPYVCMYMYSGMDALGMSKGIYHTYIGYCLHWTELAFFAHPPIHPSIRKNVTPKCVVDQQKAAGRASKSRVSIPFRMHAPIICFPSLRLPMRRHKELLRLCLCTPIPDIYKMLQCVSRLRRRLPGACVLNAWFRLLPPPPPPPLLLLILTPMVSDRCSLLLGLLLILVAVSLRIICRQRSTNASSTLARRRALVS